MSKKLKWFYRISIWMIVIFFSANILVKAIIWSLALKKTQGKISYSITISQGALRTKNRYTTMKKQKIFKTVDYLLAPAFTMLFMVIAVKLAKVPKIFEED